MSDMHCTCGVGIRIHLSSGCYHLFSASLPSPRRRIAAPRRGHAPPARDQRLRLRLRLQRLPAELQRHGLWRLLRHARRLLARDQSIGAGRHAARDLPGKAITQRWLVCLVLTCRKYLMLWFECLLSPPCEEIQLYIGVYFVLGVEHTKRFDFNTSKIPQGISDACLTSERKLHSEFSDRS